MVFATPAWRGVSINRKFEPLLFYRPKKRISNPRLRKSPAKVIAIIFIFWKPNHHHHHAWRVLIIVKGADRSSPLTFCSAFRATRKNGVARLSHSLFLVYGICYFREKVGWTSAGWWWSTALLCKVAHLLTMLIGDIFVSFHWQDDSWNLSI